MGVTKIFKEFFENEKTGGLVLIIATVLSFALANSAWDTEYIGFWHYELGHHSIAHWVNDALMTIFFLMIGLELVREIHFGELSNMKKAMLPIVGALGGMIFPAIIYLSLNYGTDAQSGFGIPMATDIAFAVGILSILGKRVPPSLKVFLTALAVIDDLGAILIIAIFYSASISILNLRISLAIFGLLLVLKKYKVYNLIPYIIGGVIMWYFMLNSGVHATITGVLLAITIPVKKGEKDAPARILEHFLYKPVSFIILPLFAMANTCIPIGAELLEGMTHSSSIGIMAGLFIGKPLGIWLFSFISVGLGLCALPGRLKWKNIFGAGLLGGIGFTMSIFVTLLAFDTETVINYSKLAIITASLVSGIVGFVFLHFTLKKD